VATMNPCPCGYFGDSCALVPVMLERSAIPEATVNGRPAKRT
jgi:hypothetical protein